MVAYIVFTRERTRDPGELDTYSQEVSASLTGHDVTTRAYYGRQEVLEGAAVDARPRRVVCLDLRDDRHAPPDALPVAPELDLA